MPGPEIDAVITMLRESPPFGGDDINTMRAGMREATAAMPLPEDVRFERIEAGRTAVPAEWAIAPNARDDRVVVYLHGGGYVMGGVDTHRGLVADLSRAASARVLSVDYRLAPENPHPAAVEDAASAFLHVVESGVAPGSIAIGGDSAGGGLTVAALLHLRTEGAALPGAAFCISPWSDLTLSGESMQSKAQEDPMVQAESLGMMAAAYLAGADAATQTASPALADLTGLPPLLVQVGTREVLLDDARMLAKAAESVGVDVTYEEWEDMIHVWHAFASLVPEGHAAIERIADHLEQHLQ